MPYNLLDELWVPVLYRDGIVKRVGICKALEDAHLIRQIAASNPMDRVAILRFLLALLYWCKGNAQNDECSTSGGSFPSNWFKKLDDNRHCFDLLGDGTRFYQYKRGDFDKDEKLSANYLIQDVPTGTNFLHFRHSIDKTNGLCPACCAMGLLRIPSFATSGGRGKPPGINAKPPLYIISLGSSLADTLRLSWRQVSDSILGTPAWENPDLKLPDKGKVPLLTGLTWLPRRVWLDDPENCESNCISCGSRARLIKHCIFSGVGSQRTDGNGQGRVWSDPHVIYDDMKNIMKPGDALGSSDAASGQWAKVMARILEEQKNKASREVWVVGFATVQNDKYLEAMEYVIPFSAASDDRKLQDIIQEFEEWQKKFLRKHIEIRSIVNSILPHIGGVAFSKAIKRLAGKENQWEQAACEYGLMAAIAKSVSPGCTIAAVERQRLFISQCRTRGQLQEAAKPGREKEGNR